MRPRLPKLEVYAFSTPNSVKVPIALEELALDCTLHPVNIRAGGRKWHEFTALNPNAKVPVLVDPTPWAAHSPVWKVPPSWSISRRRPAVCFQRGVRAAPAC